MSQLTRIWQSAYLNLLAGESPADDVRRREFTLNVLLAGGSLCGSVALIYTLCYGRIHDILYHGNSLSDVSLATLMMFSLWWLSRSRHHTLAAYLFLSFIAYATLNLALDWSFELPTVCLLSTLLIIIAGMVLNTQAALSITAILTIGALCVGQAQISQQLRPDITWLNEPLQMTNSVDYSLLLAIIGLVSWLANAEIDRSLQRAQVYAQELADERDGLERKVAMRTQELEQLQIARTLELQRFAEFGRLSSVLLHEVANPLTAASLNLQQANGYRSPALREARKSLRELERYVEAARKQLKAESHRRHFGIRHELNHVSAVLVPLAREASITLSIAQPDSSLKLFGDPVKFNQIIANLVVNAIEAYENICTPRQKMITVTIETDGQYLQISVQDWGAGIKQDQLELLFTPFYSTKTNGVRGLGIGLAMVKEVVEAEFNGSIMVSSSKGLGTTFTASFRLPVYQNKHQRATNEAPVHLVPILEPAA